MPKVIFQNHPYTEKERIEPFLITKKEVVPFIFPNPKDARMDYSDISYMYLSTNEITCSYYEISPGSWVEIPDYHPGDEVYIVLEGTLTMLNTEAGQVVQVHEGECLLMPEGAKHCGFNFEQKKVRTMSFIAPKIFTEAGFPTDEIGRHKVYNGKLKPEEFRKYTWCETKNRAGVLDDLGAWPADGPESRKSPFFHFVPEDKKLLAIHGLDNPVLMKVSVSNDYLNVVELVIPSGGKGARMTDPDQHPNEAFLYMDKGVISVLIHDTGETFQIREREGLYIPKGMTYQLFNYESETMNVFLCTKCL